jgi:DNA-binding transcriptional ArsR family regulator
MTYDMTLQCLSDATRRRVFERLRAGPQSVGMLAKGMPVSRPAVSQHLKALKDAGLVCDRAQGARRVYYIDPDGLGPLRRWIDEFWDDALHSFKRAVEAASPTRGKMRA